MTVAIYPGSFDPVTYGHLDVIGRAAGVFERVVVGVLANPRKAPLLSTAERLTVLRTAIDETLPAAAPRIDVVAFDGLTVDFARASGGHFIVRGLRAVSDFESEMQMAHTNRKLAAEVDTVFFMTALEHAYLSSTLVKEIALLGGDVSAMIPPAARGHVGTHRTVG